MPAAWVWEHLWPLLILSLALALLLLGWALRSVWLTLPAAIVAALGGGRLLTATTGAMFGRLFLDVSASLRRYPARFTPIVATMVR